MKFQYLGTAAAEGLPAFFCTCDNCKRARAMGGRAIRTRSQALIDGKLLLDFPPDTYMHTVVHGIDLLDVEACIITHRHHDHFFPEDIDMLKPGFAHVPEGWHIDFFGSDKVNEKISPKTKEILARDNTATFHEVAAFDTFVAGGYRVTAFPAVHDPSSGPLFYQIEGEGKTVLYGNDTFEIREDVWEYWERTKPHFDMVSLDCTFMCRPTKTAHMGLAENVLVRRRMLDMGIADDNTVFVCHHFSHNPEYAIYDDFAPIARREGFLVSYDGMVIDL